jgi:hypothetical protein
MKNKLAENMLRFGVKNLKADDVKKIEESVLTEAFKDEMTGITWQLNFKNQDALNNFISPSVAQSEKNTVYNGIPASQLTWAYWASLAFLGISPNKINGKTSFNNIATMFNKAGALGQNQILRSQGWKFAETKEAMENPAAAKFWNTAVTNPANPKTMITRWELFYNTNILPVNAARLALIAAAPMTPNQPTKF